MLWTIWPNGFLESGKTRFYFHARGDNINTVYPNLVQKLLRNENILNIKIWNGVASLSMLSSLNSIVLHRSWFILCTWQRFNNQVYTSGFKTCYDFIIKNLTRPLIRKKGCCLHLRFTSSRKRFVLLLVLWLWKWKLCNLK